MKTKFVVFCGFIIGLSLLAGCASNQDTQSEQMKQPHSVVSDKVPKNNVKIASDGHTKKAGYCGLGGCNPF